MMKNVRRHNHLLLALALGAVAASACGPTWMVIREGGSPPPLRGAGPITVSFDYSRLLVEGKNEQAFVQDKLVKNPDYEKSWAELKQQLETNFINGMAADWPAGVGVGPAGSAGVHATVFPTAFTIGHYMVVAATNTEMEANVSFTVNGQLADEISIRGAERATVYRPTVFAQMPPLAVYLGKVTNRFVVSKNK
jgi:hypothetical protein